MPKRRLPPNTDWPGRGVAPRPTRGRKMKGGDWSINDARQSVGPIGRQQVAGLFGARVAQTILARDQCDRTQQAGHMDASDPIKPENSCATGAVHIWVLAFARTTWVIVVSTLQNITGTIALAGAGKMGGAMLTGWLAQGLDAGRVVVIEPTPSPEISALASKGVRLNPAD